MKDLSLILKTQKERGLALQSAFPFVRSFYRVGLSNHKIAELICDNQELCEQIGFVGRVPSMSNIVRFALVGNPYNSDDRYGPFYSGLLARAEYDALSRKHREFSGTTSQKNNLENGKGILFQTKDQLVEAARASAKSRGRVAWTNEEEIAMAHELKEEGYSHRAIASKLNTLYHLDKTKVTKSAVDNFFRRYKSN